MQITIRPADNTILIKFDHAVTETSPSFKTLRELRLNNGYTQQQLGNAIKTVPNTISSIENGRMKASNKFRSKLAEFYGLSIDQIPTR